VWTRSYCLSLSDHAMCAYVESRSIIASPVQTTTPVIVKHRQSCAIGQSTDPSRYKVLANSGWRHDLCWTLFATFCGEYNLIENSEHVEKFRLKSLLTQKTILIPKHKILFWNLTRLSSRPVWHLHPTEWHQVVWGCDWYAWSMFNVHFKCSIMADEISVSRCFGSI